MITIIGVYAPHQNVYALRIMADKSSKWFEAMSHAQSTLSSPTGKFFAPRGNLFSVGTWCSRYFHSRDTYDTAIYTQCYRFVRESIESPLVTEFILQHERIDTRSTISRSTLSARFFSFDVQCSEYYVFYISEYISICIFFFFFLFNKNCFDRLCNFFK